MSTLHKVKAYFGMAPMEDYDDEYYDDHAPARTGGAYPRQRFADDSYGPRYEGREYDAPRAESEYAAGSYRGGYADEARFRGPDYERTEMPRARFGSLRGST